VGVVEPGRALVVEIGERALLEDGGGRLVDGQDAVGIDFFQPGLAQLVEASCALVGVVGGSVRSSERPGVSFHQDSG
jgi:hypothetical protein